MSGSSTWSFSLKALPLWMVMHLFMAWPNFSARDGIPTDFADDSSKLQRVLTEATMWSKYSGFRKSLR